MMATAATQELNEVVLLRNQNRMIHSVVRMNTDGLSHADSLVQPQPAGNSMNWIVGHLLCVYNNVLQGAFGQAPVMPPDSLKCYDRGTPTVSASDAVEFSALLAAWDEAIHRFDAGLSTLSSERLDEKAPFSPTNNPEETVRSVMGVVMFHQAYHAGQTGVLRRVAGKPGAIK